MKVSISWLKQLVELNCSVEELVNLLPLRSISTKEVADKFIELDMKGYNRADLLSMRGVAREVAAITGSKLAFEEPQEAEFVWNKQDLPKVSIEIKDPQLAPVYCVAKIEGLKSGLSNESWIQKLEESEVRTVNNIADVTNLIMLEYGQPMHAFDARAVKDEKIIVRVAQKGERITTLDGKTRDLQTSDLLIADSQNALGIAGVMGGKDSEVNETTSTILLEAAIFDSISIRQTANRLALLSEASRRFQHGLTKTNLLKAMDAAIKMYQSLGGKLTAISLLGNLEDQARKIILTKKKLDELIGVKISTDQVESYLKSLNLQTRSAGSDFWEVTVPYWRLDVNIEEDVVEEVARMYGYEKIPAEKVSQSQPLQKEEPIFQQIQDLRKKLVDLGLTEVQTYSFYSTDILRALGSDKEKLVKVANPISAETEYLRDKVWPSLVEVVGKNLRKGFKDIGIFEIGKAFGVGKDGNPKESYRLTIALCNNTDNPVAELHQLAQNIIDSLGVKLGHPPGGQDSYFHPKRVVGIEKDGKRMGNLAEVHLRMLNKLGIEKRVAILEINL
ncbi:MAG: phenylalanine--tRNA ligase subunit beta [Candidatus Daviesbacteria bacterium]|nr:MAG: phenylalanine--tRNA ligase subunit beta [Candidatus Daviesbacteria bacterium]